MDAINAKRIALLADKTLEYIEAQRAEAVAYLKTLDDAASRLEDEKEKLKNSPENCGEEKIFELIDELDIASCKTSRQIFSGIPDYEKQFRFAENFDDSDRHETELIAKRTLGIAAFLEEEYLHVKMPLLEHRRKSASISKANDKHYSMHDNQLAEYVTAVIEDAIKSAAYNPETFERTHIQFCILQKRKNIKADLDSYDISPIINALTLNTAGGDRPQNCSFSLTEIEDFLLPEGTYICLMPQEKKQKSEEEIVGFWRNHLAGNQKTDE